MKGSYIGLLVFLVAVVVWKSESVTSAAIDQYGRASPSRVARADNSRLKLVENAMEDYVVRC